jgi:hypothetical protein
LSRIEQVHVKYVYGYELSITEKGIAQADQRSVEPSGAQDFAQHIAAVKADDEVDPLASGSELLDPLGEQSPTEPDGTGKVQ